MNVRPYFVDPGIDGNTGVLIWILKPTCVRYSLVNVSVNIMGLPDVSSTYKCEQISGDIRESADGNFRQVVVIPNMKTNIINYVMCLKTWSISALVSSSLNLFPRFYKSRPTQFPIMLFNCSTFPFKSVKPRTLLPTCSSKHFPIPYTQINTKLRSYKYFTVIFLQ
jgi:hypothetical protein